MPDPARRACADLRLLRAAVFTAVCVVLSAGGHVLASDEIVPLWTLGAAAAVVFVIAAVFAGRERSLFSIAAGMAVGQLALHSLFGIGQHHAAAGGTQPGGAIPLARRLLCNDAGMTLSEGQAREIVSNAGLDPDAQAGHAAHAAQQGASAWETSAYSLPMLLGHLLAALAAGWLLRRGETALWRLVRIAARSELRPLRAAALYFAVVLRSGAPMGRPVVVRAAGEEPKPREALLQHSLSRRGPPAYGLAA